MKIYLISLCGFLTLYALCVLLFIEDSNSRGTHEYELVPLSPFAFPVLAMMVAIPITLGLITYRLLENHERKKLFGVSTIISAIFLFFFIGVAILIFIQNSDYTPLTPDM